MAWLNAYSCATAAGDTHQDLWRALLEGQDFAQPHPTAGGVKSFLFQGSRPESVRQLLLEKLKKVALQMRPQGFASFNGPRFGVIFASTKGMSNDFIWQPEAAHWPQDPLTPILNDFLQVMDIQPGRALCVSNACSSALAALALAQLWIDQGLEHVLVLAADAATPFVIQGFQSLKLITADRPRPFAANRSGFFLGEAAACLLLEKARGSDGIFLHPIGLDTEGSAVTRPSHSGDSLVRAAHAIASLRRPDVIVAHGTSTVINDETEDLVFARLFASNPAPITGSKWCIGHTLGASAAVDLILGCEILKRQTVFALKGSDPIDSTFHGHYVNQGAVEGLVNTVLVSSLGFGGMHAMGLLEKMP